MNSTLPEQRYPGAIPAMNGRGFVLEELDPFSEEFVQFAVTVDGEVLDIGCGYGAASLAALKQGARVCACDMEQGHLDVLTEKAPEELKSRLRTVTGTLPDIQFPAGSFHGILASRVIHFLSGPDIRTTLDAMFHWLKEDGRLFLVAVTPFMSNWRGFVPTYEKAKAAGEVWPGFIHDFPQYSATDSKKSAVPKFLNTLDVDIIERECRRAGFEIEKSSFIGLPNLGEDATGLEQVACVARKPVGTVA